MKNLILIFAFVLLIPTAGTAQGTSFNFQGRLNDGTSSGNGQYDLQFRLYDAFVGGNPIGPLLSRPNTILINGVFSVRLDFGSAVIFDSPRIYMEIGVRPTDSPNTYTILGPRQQVTVVPLSLRAYSTAIADQATNALHAASADVATNAVNAATATNSLTFDGLPSSSYAKLNVINTGDLRATGSLAIDGDAFQPIAKNGFVKAMLYVQQDGTILRCYNGITNTSSGNCGFTINHVFLGNGVYHVFFNFRIDDRFLTVTARNPTVVSTFVAASFQFVSGNPNAVDVITFITNAGTVGGDEANFMLVVY